MEEKDRQYLFNLAKEYLEKAIYIDLKLRIIDGKTIAGAHAKLIKIARSYFLQEAIRMGLVNSYSDKNILDIFYLAVDDYIFNKIADAVAQIENQPVEPPMKMIFEK